MNVIFKLKKTMTESDCEYDEYEMSEYEYECVWKDNDKFDKSDDGMTWVSLTRMILTWVWGSMERVSVAMNDIK